MDLILSESEKRFIVDGVKDNCRVDGRECFDYRCIDVESDVISSCAGSGHIRLGNCEIMVGVKCEFSEPSLDESDVGKLEFFVDVSPNASPLFDRKKDSISNNLIAALSHSITPCIDLHSLCVEKGKYVWTVFIDILVLELGSRPNLLDACAIAVKAALYNTKIPKVTIDCETNEPTVSENEIIRIDVSRVPLFITVTRIGNQYVVDATQEEEASSISSVLFAITPDGEITHMKKVKYGSLCPEPLKDVFHKVKDLAIDMHRNLMNALIEESKVRKSTNKISFLF
ncbi:exosome complex component RRP42-like protein [Dinothrombium tinctorium]|uniref:Ribosomal RNA-processing protein 42 n=1 Tax=Dinothrombium tinctorium TaxID=1965070 RepID=A0A443R2C8_9ACAR|nr:exosome complex component RRP42-like protein [Dinothrombium tinctorium]